MSRLVYSRLDIHLIYLLIHYLFFNTHIFLKISFKILAARKISHPKLLNFAETISNSVRTVMFEKKVRRPFEVVEVQIWVT